MSCWPLPRPMNSSSTTRRDPAHPFRTDRDRPCTVRRPTLINNSAPVPVVEAEPGPFSLPPGRVALVIIDMQRDFLLPGGFGETLGNDVSQLAVVVPPLQRVLAAARSAGMMIIHT